MLDFNYKPDEIREILVKYGSASQLMNAEIFNYGNSLIKKYQKLGVLSEEPDEPEENNSNTIICDVINCKQEFKNVAEFESHWRLTHYYKCKVCRKNLPSNHLLELHIMETHDSFFELQKEKKAMFSCYLEECTEKFHNSLVRKDHCITVHGFRADFKFEKPVKKLNKKDDKMDTSDDSQTQKRYIPKEFHFGHGGQKVFKTTKQKKDPLEEMAVDLKEHLPDV